jgi:hypothetical protein
LHAKKGWVPDFAIPFIKKHRVEFREKVNDIRRTYKNKEEDGTHLKIQPVLLLLYHYS